MNLIQNDANIINSVFSLFDWLLKKVNEIPLVNVELLKACIK